MQVGTVDVHCTDLHWVPSASRRQQQGSDVFAAAFTDGAGQSKIMKHLNLRLRHEGEGAPSVLLLRLVPDNVSNRPHREVCGGSHGGTCYPSLER